MNRWILAAPVFAAALVLGCSPRETGTGESPTSTPGATSTTYAASPTATPTAGNTPAGPNGLGAPEFDTTRAMQHINALAVEIRERVAGTEGEDEAAAYIAGEFESYGYDVEIQPFEFDGERYGLSFIDLPETELTGYHLIGSAGGTVTAPTVYLGLGREEDYAGKAVAGRIAVVDRGVISFNDKYERAEDDGALGMIVINSAPGALAFANLDTRSVFPVVGVEGEAGDAVRSLAERNGEVTLRVPDDEIGKAVNVLAKSAGTETCAILVGGHHDTVPASPGANDNGSGVAHVLELARALAADGLDDGICFATFGAEEHGLFGSKHLAAQMEEDDAVPQLMVNFDVTGVGSLVEVIGQFALREAAIAVGQELGIEVIASSLPPNTGSDHQSFEAVGAEVIFFTSGEYGEIHTPQDTVDLIQEDEMDRVGRVALAFLRDRLEHIAQG